MAKSKQIYNVVISSAYSKISQDGGATLFNLDTREVDIIASKADGVMAHEIKHGHQFEKGEISLQVSLKGKPRTPYGWLAYDLQDEVAAYQRQKEFGTGVPSTWQSDYLKRIICNRQYLI